MGPFTPEQYLKAADWLERTLGDGYLQGRVTPLKKIVDMLRASGGSEPALFDGATADDSGGVFVQSVLRVWNATMDGSKIPKVRVGMVPVLLRNRILARAKETGHTIDVFERVFRFLRHDPFYSGAEQKDGDRKWVADIRFAVRSEDNFAKLVEKALAAPKRGDDEADEIAPGCTHRPGCRDAVACTSRRIREART